MSGTVISVGELRGRIDDPDLRVVDCRWYLDDPQGGLTAYRSGHVPGAMFVSLDEDLADPPGEGRHPLPTPERFGNVVARLGITPKTPVVAYDDRGGAVAARLWWMLTRQGHTDVSVLDGGIQAWTSEGLPVTTTIPDPQRGGIPARPWEGVADVEDVGTRTATTVLVDVRAPERYRGLIEPVDPKAGHIPGARSLPLTANLDRELRFLPPAALTRNLDGIGVSRTTSVIAQCGSGVNACHLILAMELAGLPPADLYVGSWSDWSGRDLPVATGEDP
jgi:thiosulfate/3-mercaptopyruvate sulfurtransferase